MRDINKCRAEVFCRAENKIKNQKRRRRCVFSVCVPLCLIVGVFSAFVLPRMLPTDKGSVATTGKGDGVLSDMSSPSIPNVSGNNKKGLECDISTDLKPISYSFSLTWNAYGTCSYDSLTGRLVKAADATDPDDYTTVLHLDDEKLLEIREIIDDLDIESYPDNYDPFGDGQTSKPTVTLILGVKTEKIEKTIIAEGISDSYISGDPKGQKFLDACYKIRDIITATDEWKALP